MARTTTRSKTTKDRSPFGGFLLFSAKCHHYHHSLLPVCPSGVASAWLFGVADGHDDAPDAADAREGGNHPQDECDDSD